MVGVDALYEGYGLAEYRHVALDYSFHHLAYAHLMAAEAGALQVWVYV